MLRYSIVTALLMSGGAALAQSAAPATTPAAAAVTEPLPRCSAEIRDRCRQDERFARDVARAGGSRDNNAMAYRTSKAAAKRQPQR